MNRIVFYHPSADWAGLARVYLEMGLALKARGVEVAIACPSPSVVATVCSALTVLPFVETNSWFSDGSRLATILRDFEADAVVVADDEPNLVAAWGVRRSGRGAVLRRMRTGISSPVTLKTRLAVRLAPTWFVHSSAADATASEPVARLRGRIIADLAVDASAFDRVIPAPTPLGTSTIVIVTDPEAQRATAAALRTVAALRSRGHPLRTLILGMPHDVNEVRVHATALGLGDAIALLGDPIDRAPLLAAADLVWVVADHDDGGIAVLDAMALGRAVIVTRGTMAERYVRHGETGMITERDDALSSAAMLTMLQAAPATIEAIGAAARDELRSRRDPLAASDAIVAILRDAAAAQVAA
jgi:glycosyltransferase involved in cell wall biosynthesis